MSSDTRRDMCHAFGKESCGLTTAAGCRVITDLLLLSIETDGPPRRLPSRQGSAATTNIKHQTKGTGANHDIAAAYERVSRHLASACDRDRATGRGRLQYDRDDRASRRTSLTSLTCRSARGVPTFTNQPFVFQLHRADGAAWTESHTIPAGKYFAVKAPQGGATTEIQGITGNGRGYVIIRHREPVLGGYLTVRLPAMNPDRGQVQPTWFAVKDANGICRLVQDTERGTSQRACRKLCVSKRP